jgi:hypothetical protein
VKVERLALGLGERCACTGNIAMLVAKAMRSAQVDTTNVEVATTTASAD